MTRHRTFGALAALLGGLACGPAPAGDMSADEIAHRLMMQRAAPAPATRSVGAAIAALPHARTGAKPAPQPDAPPGATLGVRPPVAVAASVIDLEILFELGSADLGSSARRQLGALCAALTADLAAGPRIYQIIGHTDAAGDERANLILSQSRADSVAAWLAGPECGLDRRRLSPVGMGERRLKLPQDPEAAANRRVEIQSLS